MKKHYFIDPDLLKYAEELKQKNYHEYMKLLYLTYTEDFEICLIDDKPLDIKIKVIDKIREYFASTEEYEKCSKLKLLSDYLISNTKKDNDEQIPDTLRAV